MGFLPEGSPGWVPALLEPVEVRWLLWLFSHASRNSRNAPTASHAGSGRWVPGDPSPRWWGALLGLHGALQPPVLAAAGQFLGMMVGAWGSLLPPQLLGGAFGVFSPPIQTLWAASVWGLCCSQPVSPSPPCCAPALEASRFQDVRSLAENHLC